MHPGNSGAAARAPWLHQVLLQSGQRTLSKEADAWLNHNDLLELLDSLAAHMLRTLPVDMTEELEPWADSQQGAESTAALQPADITGRTVTSSTTGCTTEHALWNATPVLLRVLTKPATRDAPTVQKAQRHRLACAAAVLPTLRALHHPAVLPVLGVVPASPACDLTVVYARPGPSLRAELVDRAAAGEHVSGAEALAVVGDVVAALSHMHARHVLHRDLSAGSVYARPDGAAGYCVGDFDFAVRSSKGRATNAWLPPTRAPETLRTRVFDKATDVYALGLLMVELCFYGDQEAALAAVSSFQHGGSVPRHVPALLWQRLIQPCIDTSPGGRPALHAVRHTIAALSPADLGAQRIPRPSEDVTVDELSSLHAMHAPSNVHCGADVECDTVTAAGWPHVCHSLAGNTALRSLRITHTDVGSAALAPSSEARVEIFAVEDCQGVTAEWCRPALGSPLTALRLDACLLGDSATAELVALLPRCPNLRSLQLSRVGAGPDTAQALTTAVGSGAGAAVEELDLSSNPWPPSAVAQLTSLWWQRSPSLRALRLRCVALDYYTVGQLGQLLRQCGPDMRVLDLRHVHLSPPSLSLLLAGHKAGGARVAVLLDEAVDHRYAEELRASSEAILRDRPL